MKKFSVLICLCFALCLTMPFSAVAAESKTLTVLYSGNVLGYIVPTRHCYSPEQLGGLARVSTLVEQVRKETGEVLLLDAGGLFPIYAVGPALIAEFSLKAMNQIGYNAMNLGWNELRYASSLLDDMGKNIAFPFITSNAVQKDSNLPVGKKYHVRQIGNIKVGILGIMPLEPAEALPNPQFMERFTVTPPEDALKTLVPEVRKEADFVILLSHCGFKATSDLVSQVKGIDLAITGADGEREVNETEPGCQPDPESASVQTKADGKTVPVMQIGYGLKSLGLLKLTLDDKGQIAQHESRLIKLDMSIPSDPQIAEITGTDLYKKVADVRKERDEEDQRKRQEAQEMLKLSPEEYLKKMNEKQAGTGGGK
jgi:2',3'-cyclic-nucleotide 2'-phosphodiesterase (5'-nucleotidase family)